MSCLSRGIAVLDVINDNVGIDDAGRHGGMEAGKGIKVYPNPFKYNTSISFTIPDDGFVSLSIIDISGRVVSELAGAYYPSGTHSLTWNGSDNHGRQLNPGMYVCRLITGSESKSIRIIVQ